MNQPTSCICFLPVAILAQDPTLSPAQVVIRTQLWQQAQGYPRVSKSEDDPQQKLVGPPPPPSGPAGPRLLVISPLLLHTWRVTFWLSGFQTSYPASRVGDLNSLSGDEAPQPMFRGEIKLLISEAAFDPSGSMYGKKYCNQGKKEGQKNIFK